MKTSPLREPLADQEIGKRAAPRRVAIVCDFLDEQWYSMDLVGDMLYEHLRAGCSSEVSAMRIRPSLGRWFRRVPLVGENKLCFQADCMFGRFCDYPRKLRREKTNFELFHIVDHSYSQLAHVLPADRTIITCHDLDTFRCLLRPQEEKRPRWFQAMVRYVLDGFLKARHVICCSSTVRDELLSLGLFPAERVSVIPNGVHPSCSPYADPVADDEASRLLQSHPGEHTEILHVGTTAPRKRIDVLLRVLAAIGKHSDVRLIRVGGALTDDQRRLAHELGVSNVIIELPYLQRNVLAAVYRRAALLLQTSEREGFGLPLVEAMACGCPVVASDLPVLREIGGIAAAYCPVADIDLWAGAAARLLHERAERPREWALRREQVVAHADGFSWAEAACQTARIYATVLSERRC